MRHLEKIGSFGSIVAAAACPACFPQLAAFGMLVGLGALGAYESEIFLATQILVVVAIVGHALAYARQRRLALLLLGAGGGILFFAGMYLVRSEIVVYAGLLAMLVASVSDLLRRQRIRREAKLHTTPE